MRFRRCLFRSPHPIHSTATLRISLIAVAILVAFYLGAHSGYSSTVLVVTMAENVIPDKRSLLDSRLDLDNVKTRHLYNTDTSSLPSKKIKVNGLGYTYKGSTSLGITDATRSSYSISYPYDSVIPHGIVFTIHIVARDSSGRHRTTGGDLWSVQMRSATTERTATVGKTIDHSNGTYTTYMYSGWRGHPFAWRPIKVPECEPNIPQGLSDGYWYEGVWNSLACHSTISSTSGFLRCLHNTSMFFLGDNHLQQRALTLLNVLNVTQNDTINGFNTFQNVSFQESGYNISLFYKPHPFTGETKLTDMYQASSSYEAELMNSLSNNASKSVLLVGPSYHLQYWQVDAYREYLEHLREATVQFLKRMPFGKIVLMSPPFFTDDYKMQGIYQHMDNVQREVFEGSGVYFMDVYDLEQAASWGKLKDVTPEVLKEEMHLFLSLVC
ncbi:putative NXPE family member 3-like [Apostichopus japonicus]|uniref:Putative NXPE family member 3-like n=1 Tax=Stichopus japonicus TaxID=307972 RepID=A0A2G8K5N5_STIJA|nr:putative NXPE family member 3-like [Apostichopus japonicus]